MSRANRRPIPIAEFRVPQSVTRVTPRRRAGAHVRLSVYLLSLDGGFAGLPLDGESLGVAKKVSIRGN